MNNEKSIHVATGVWYELNFGHTKYHHFPCHMDYERYFTDGTKYISALEGCEPISKTWGADYDTLNGARPRSTRQLIDLTRTVCADFLKSAEFFVKNGNKDILLPMVSVYMQRLVNGATCYHGQKGYMHIKQDGYYEGLDFIYSNVNCLVTPSNISDVLKKKIEHIHVIRIMDTILWNQQSKLDPDTPLYVYNRDVYDDDGGVYVRILDSNTQVVNKNLCLISPKTTGHIPSKMAELFRQKTVSTIHNAQSRNYKEH